MRALGIALIVLIGIWGWMRSGETPALQPIADTHVPAPTLDQLPASTTAAQEPPPDTLIGTAMETPAQDSWKAARATVFWVGEGEGADNGFIHNRSSAWDVEWEQSFGGYDDPDCRDGFHPCGFTPTENPFYIALPYNDLFLDGHHKDDPRLPKGARTRYKSDLKNRWIVVRSSGITCYAQWQDVGPFGEDDIEYVFGEATVPLNTQGERAGIDLSPAVRDCLKVGGLSEVEWRHVEASDVPPGPWHDIVTEEAE